MLKGIAASQGVAVAKVYKLEQPVLDIQKVEVTDLEAEKAKIERAFAKTVEDIEESNQLTVFLILREDLSILPQKDTILRMNDIIVIRDENENS